jgi:tRNA(Ile)-lysidine synthase
VQSALSGPASAGRRDPVLVACSGGADSLALAAGTAFVCERSGRPYGLVTIDHGLQPGSAEQSRRVAELGYQLGFDPVHLVRVAVGTAGGPEAAARTARFAALDRLSDGPPATTVLLGHTADDQAETVLLGLGRGSGPRSIAGMRPAAGRYLRPLLGLRRADTAAACEALGLPVWQDPHNGDPRFRRVRLRTEVLPLLEDVLGGGVVPALARTAGLLQQDLDALAAIAAGFVPAAGAGLPVEPLRGQPVAIRTRALKAWAEANGSGPLTSRHVGELDSLLSRWRGQGPIDLPGGVRATRSSGTLALSIPAIAEHPTRSGPAAQPPQE